MAETPRSPPWQSPKSIRHQTNDGLVSRESCGLLNKRDEVVLADALQHQERSRGVPTIGDQVRAARRDRVRLAGAEPNLLFRVAQKEPELSADYVSAAQALQRKRGGGGRLPVDVVLGVDTATSASQMLTQY